MTSLTAQIDITDGLAVRSSLSLSAVTLARSLRHSHALTADRDPQHVGLEQYTELFMRHEVGRPLLELLDENRAIWEELFAADLSEVRVPSRPSVCKSSPIDAPVAAARHI